VAAGAAEAPLPSRTQRTFSRSSRPSARPAHTTDRAGAHNIGTTYADALKPVVTPDAPSACFKDGDAKTMPKLIGECTVPAIMEGWMPMAMGCFNTPRPAECVTLEQQDVVTRWVAAGMPQ